MNEQELRNYIVNNTDESYFIKAGAGAGKTYTVVLRIINQLASGLKPEEIVVITFTKKASEELLSRMLKMVSEAAGKETDEIRKKNLIYASDNINRMQISTIHSFCNRLIAEQIFKAKLPIGIKLLEDDELEKELSDYFLNHYLDNREKIERAELIAGKSVKKDIYDLFKTFAFMANDTTVVYDKEALEDEEFEEKLKKAFNDYYKGLLGIINNYLGTFHTEFDDDTLKCLLSTVKNPYLEDDYRKLYVAIKKDPKAFTTRSTPLKKEDVQAANESLDGLTNSYLEVGKRIDSRKNAALIEIALDIAKSFKKNKKNTYLSNDELLNIAADLVFDREAYEFYHDKFKCFYIDEFQDTDHIQSKMILKLCSKSYDDDSLVPGKLVVVGDYKQSIYRFRGADLNEYFKVENIFKKQNNKKIRIIDLAFNFRSSEMVIDWVNEGFKDVIEEYSDMTYSQKEKRDKAKEDSGYDPNKVIEGVYYLQSADIKASNLLEKDLDFIIRLIKNCVDNYYIYDSKKEKYRLIRYSDFLLLTRTTTDMNTYLDSLIDAGLPVSLAGKISANTNIEIQRFIRMYRYLSLKEADKLSKEAVLQNEINDLVSDYDLNEEFLNKLKEDCANLDGHSLLVYLSRHLEYVLNINTEMKKEKLRLAIGRIEQMCEFILTHTPNNSALIRRALDAYLEKEIKRELSLSSDNNAIQLMNVHQSKGLEGGIVIIANRKNITKKPVFAQVNEGDKYYYYPCVGNSSSYTNNEELTAYSENEEAKELSRLEYVAVTRAKEALIVLPGVENSFLNSICKKTVEINNGVELPLGINNVSKKTETLDYVSKSVKEIDEAQSLITYKEVLPSSMEVHDIKGEYSDDRPKGKDFGSLLHKCMELSVESIVNNKDIDNDELILRAIKQCGYNDLSVKHYLKEVLNKNLDEDFINRLNGADKVLMELPFYVNLNDKYVHGFMDLVLITNDKYQIIDYKSDAPFKDESEEEYLERLNHQYSGQLNLYKEALAKILKIDESAIETELKVIKI